MINRPDARWLASSGPIVPKARPRRDLGVGSLVLVSFGLVGLAGVVSGTVVEVFLAWFGLAGLSFAWVLGMARREDRRALRYAALRTEFEGDGRLVSLLIRQGDAPTGADAGVLWFEAGRLYFSGRRTSFGLVPAQARAVSPPRTPVPRLRHEVDVTLRRDSAAGAMALSFSPILPPHGSATVEIAALRTDLRDWAGGQAEGPGQFPPSGFGPGIVGDRRLLAETLLVTLPLPLALGTLFEVVYPALAPFASAFGFLVATSLPAGNLRLRALRDRRRLRRLG